MENNAVPVRYINYTREAFFLPIHLVSLSAAAMATVAAMVGLHWWLEVNPLFLPLLLGGAELTYLGLIPRNKRFIAAVNRKYGPRIQAWHFYKNLSEHYNRLSQESQRRFETFRANLLKAEQRYAGLNSGFPGLIADYHKRSEQLQLSCLKLLLAEARCKKSLHGAPVSEVEAEIKGLEEIIPAADEKIKPVHRQRLELLNQRLASRKQTQTHLELVQAQLNTLEEMGKYFLEQPLTKESPGAEDGTVEKMIAETSDLFSTLAEIEDIYEAEGAELTPVFPQGSKPRNIRVD